MLTLRNLHVSYGSVEVLHGINMHVNEGEVVTVLGANGAGKTTTLLTISGLLKAKSGEIIFDGEPIHTLHSFEIVRRGVIQVPEGRRVFPPLTVLENLRLGAFTSKDKVKEEATLEWVFDLFPRLMERKDQLSGTLSGGEQQMLAIGRALMGCPRLLILDEPSLGLSPILVKAIFNTLKSISKTGVTVVLVEQNARAALKFAQRGYVLELGRIIMEDKAENLLANPEVQNAYLGNKS